MTTKLLGVGLVVAVVLAAGAGLAWTEERIDVRDLEEKADDRAAEIEELAQRVDELESTSGADQDAVGQVIEDALLAAETCEQSALETLNFLEAAFDAGGSVTDRHVDLTDATAAACADVRLALDG
jgi:hypothetical protein